MIAKANLAIAAAELPKISWSSPEEKAYAIAQARFFRAFAYRNLGELFGGVSLVTEVTEGPRYDFERSTRAETYQRSAEHTSELQSLMRNSYAVFCLKQKKNRHLIKTQNRNI